MRPTLWAAAMFLALAGSAAAQTFQDHVHEAFDRASRSTVAVRALSILGERSGAGVVISEDGLILTSFSVVPAGATRIRVWFHGARSTEAEIVATRAADEVTLLRVATEEPLVPIRWAQEPARIGQIVFTLGNANNAFINDDQPAMAWGIVTGRYSLAETRSGARYVGPILETSAAINPGSAGGPLLNARGEMAGMVTMNFTAHRWMGAAIPAEWVRRVVEELRATTQPEPASEPAAQGAPWVGLRAEDRDGRVVVASVEEGSPAARAGLRPGDVLVRLGRRTLTSAQELHEILQHVEVGDSIPLAVRTDAGESQLRILVEARTP